MAQESTANEAKEPTIETSPAEQEGVQALMIEPGDVEVGDVEAGAFETTLDETRNEGESAAQGVMIEAGDLEQDCLPEPPAKPS